MDLFNIYAYFWGSLVGLVIALIIYLLKPEYRKEMLAMGLIVGTFGVISEYWFFKDYWQPALLINFYGFGGIEDFMFGSAVGAIGGIIYNLITRSRTIRNFPKRRWIYLIGLFLSLFCFVILNSYLSINSIFASATALILGMLIILIIRPDLWKNALISSLVFGVLLVLGEGFILLFTRNYLPSYYLLQGQAPVLFGLFPITELIWGLAFGSVVGPLYEFAEGYSFLTKIK